MSRMRIVAPVMVFSLCLVSFAMTAAEAPENLAPNPSFENGIPPKVSDWSFWLWAPKGEKCSSACVWDDKVAHSGTRSLKIRGTEPRQVGVWDNYHGGGLIPVVTGKTYCVSVWVRTQMLPQEGMLRISVGFLDQPGSYLQEGAVTHNPILTGENDWTRVAFTVKAPEKARFARLDLMFTGIGSVWFDDAAFVVDLNA
ncbi:MAG: carbohydrate binding domain-containing protein [Verrucomicrobiota bacterium]